MISLEKMILITEILAVFLILWVAMSIYKDARSRNMWALLWTYMAILLPVAGWIIYFLLRSPTPENQCSNCFERTARRDIFCYRCSYNFVTIAKEKKIFQRDFFQRDKNFVESKK